MGMSRNSYTDYLGATLEDAVANWEGLHGIDLHGPEDLPILEWVSRCGSPPKRMVEPSRLMLGNLGLRIM